MKVTIVGSKINPKARDGMHTIRAWLLSQGVDVELIENVVVEDPDDDDKVTRQESELVADSSLVVACGGDGTTLRAARLVGYSEIPIVSFNYGHLGFLSSSDENGVIDKLVTVLSGEVEPMRRATIAADVTFANRDPQTFFALNEIVFGRADAGRIVEFALCVNGQHIADMRGDGMVLATSTGSTAYALSAGGPIVSPDHSGLVAVPIAPHTLTARPLVTGPTDRVEIRRIETPFSEACLYVDGRKPSDAVPDVIEARRGPGDVLLIQFGANDFYRTVSRTFYRGDSQCYPN